MSKAKTKAPLLTLSEDKYLRQLVEQKKPVVVRMRTHEEYTGTVEFFDAGMIRLTRTDAPNLFLYKQEIQYLWEVD